MKKTCSTCQLCQELGEGKLICQEMFPAVDVPEKWPEIKAEDSCEGWWPKGGENA